MVSDKANHIRATKADVLLSADLGCLMNIAGKLKRENASIKIFHIAEALANKMEKGIGESE
jgi:L-lactate dehydrogenase complex protein LldE